MAARECISERSLGIMRTTPNMGAKDLHGRLEDQHGVNVTYLTAWGGRKRAIDQPYCCWEESFRMLHKFKAEVELRTPGSVAEIGTKMVDGQTYFHSFFLALKPCIDGFINGCRPYLSIGSTTLDGNWNGHLASVTALDGRDWLFPVAFGFIESESTDNWTWFLQQLKKAIGDPPVLAICTNGCIDLEIAVKNVFPRTELRKSFRHLMLNFPKKFHGDIFGNMLPAARAYRPAKYEYHMNKMFTSCPDVKDYLAKHHSSLWMRSKFRTEIKCDYINNNLAEAFEDWIKDFKDFPVDELVDKLRVIIMVLFYKRRKIGDRLEGHILPAILQQLNARARGLVNLTVLRTLDHSAEVIETDKNCQTVRHVVQLLTHECTCLEWQLTGKPCPHALAVITDEMNLSVESFVDEYYSLSKFRAAYEGLVGPMTDKYQWPQIDPGFKMMPPLRKTGKGEGNPGAAQILVKGQQKCKRCRELDEREACRQLLLEWTKRKEERETKKAQRAKASIADITSNSPGPVTRRRLALMMEETSDKAVAEANATAKKKKLTPREKTN